MNIKKFSNKKVNSALIIAIICFTGGILLTTPAETHAETTIATTESAAVKNIRGIVGIWREEGVPEPKLLTINEDATYQLLYGGGGEAYGTVKLTFELHSDASKSAWYSFYDNDGEFWISFAKDENSAKQNELLSGHDGAIRFLRAPESDFHKTSADISVEDYLGTWGSGKCTVEISADGDGYLVNIKWANSAAEGSQWTYRCTYNDYSAILICNGGGTRTNYTFTASGKGIFEQKYGDGYATFVLRKGKLIWQDKKENAGDSMEFLHS